MLLHRFSNIKILFEILTDNIIQSKYLPEIILFPKMCTSEDDAGITLQDLNRKVSIIKYPNFKIASNCMRCYIKIRFSILLAAGQYIQDFRTADQHQLVNPVQMPLYHLLHCSLYKLLLTNSHPDGAIYCHQGKGATITSMARV